MKSKQILRLLALPLASLFSNTAAHAAVVDTTGTTITYTAAQNISDTQVIGNGTLNFNGSGLIGLENTGNNPKVTLAMTGGNITVQTGVTLQNGGWQGGIWTNNLSSLDLASGATLDVWDGNPVRVDALTGAGTVTIGRGEFAINWAGDRFLVLGVNGGTGTFTGNITGNSAVDGGALFLTKEGGGTQTLSGSNTYTGGTVISEGTLQIGNGGTTGTLGSGAVTIASGASLTINRSDNYGTVSNQNFSGAGTLIKEGAGELIFNGTSDHTGAQGIENLTINDGLVRTDYFGQWNSNLNLTVNGSGKLELWSASTSLGTLNGNGTVQNTKYFSRTTTLTIAAGSFSGTITDSGITTGGGGAGDTRLTLVKSGPDMLTLSGTNTYTGDTTVSGGTLRLSGSGSLNNGNYAGAITLSNSANFEKLSNEAQFLSGAITGTGTVKMDNIDGELLLQNAANDFTALNISAGRVFIQTGSGALPAAATVDLTGGTLDFDVAGTYDSAITVSSGANIAARATTSLSDVTLPGTGTVIFNNDDAPTATLDISSDQTLTDTLTVQLGGSRMGETGGALGLVTLSGVISGSGSLVMTSSGNITNPNFGTGVLVLSEENDYTGDTTVNSGTLAVNGTALPDGTKLTIDGGKVDLTNAETVNTLFFGAVQQPDGVYSASSVPAGATITTASFSGSGTLNVGPVSAYAAWQTANSTAQTVDLDHDNDGVSNGVEHFLGGIGNTTGNSNPLPGVTNNAGTLSVTWVRHPGFPGFPGNYGTSVVVETSATLTNPWTPAVTGVGAGFVEITENNVKYTFPAGTKNFARLKVIAPTP